MTINHAGALKKEYFISYMKLIMNAFGCSVEEAKDKTFKRLFQLRESEMGQETYAQFILAYRDLLNETNDE